MTNIKMGVTRKQSVPIFPKNEHFLPPDTLCAYRRLRNIRFSENLAGFFFSCNTRFKIRLFAILPMLCELLIG